MGTASTPVVKSISFRFYKKKKKKGCKHVYSCLDFTTLVVCLWKSPFGLMGHSNGKRYGQLKAREGDDGDTEEAVRNLILRGNSVTGRCW